MNKAQAIDGFWNGFGVAAYDENTVPQDALMPRITYSFVSDSIGNRVNMSASLWYRSTSWEAITKKAEEIGKSIEERNYKLLIDGSIKSFSISIPITDPVGRIYITKDVPFIQRMGDPEDDMMRRIYINTQVEFLTPY